MESPFFPRFWVLAWDDTARLIARLCRRAPRNKANQVFHWGQIIAGAGVAFMHGAQDGQKFMSIFMLGIALTAGLGQPAGISASRMADGALCG